MSRKTCAVCDYPLDPKSTTGSQVGRNNYNLEAVKVP